MKFSFYFGLLILFSTGFQTFAAERKRVEVNPPKCTAYNQQWGARYGTRSVACQVACRFDDEAKCISTGDTEPRMADCKCVKVDSTVVAPELPNDEVRVLNGPSCIAYNQQWGASYGTQVIACEIACTPDKRAVCRSTSETTASHASCSCN
ncbi:MAG: hypothetical protein NTV34_20950 [Proteobacteria bacterium]|nr:hypothetical protein [Pseudomonadota bacterium]